MRAQEPSDAAGQPPRSDEPAADHRLLAAFVAFQRLSAAEPDARTTDLLRRARVELVAALVADGWEVPAEIRKQLDADIRRVRTVQEDSTDSSRP